jgi:hypothetical protein
MDFTDALLCEIDVYQRRKVRSILFADYFENTTMVREQLHEIAVVGGMKIGRHRPVCFASGHLGIFID